MALIAGPTASGKSALAMRLAEQGPITIINADSAQVYADLRILSARPDEADMAAVPHRLFGYVDGAAACSAARWSADASRAIDDAIADGRLPVLVGGTGLYLRTLFDGIAPVPDILPEVRSAVRAMPVADAHTALSHDDPAAAARLAPADTTRVARALEVVRSTGRTLAEWQRDKVGGIGHRIKLAPLILLPPRDWLFARCDARFAAMIEQGAVEEVKRLHARNLDPALPVMRAIGVREIAGWMDGALSRDEMIQLGRIATRQYAKRQYTWFSRQPPAGWETANTQLDNEKSGQIAIKLYEKALTA